MLYLLHPHHPLRISTGTSTSTSTSTSLGSVCRSASVAPDYEHLDWHPTDDGVDAVLVRLALRHGHACRDGIVVHHDCVVLRNGAARWDNTPDGSDGSDGPAGRDSPGDLDSAATCSREEPPAELGQAYRDLILRFDAQVERDRHAMRELARRRLDDALAAPPVRALVAHWQRLGTGPDLAAAHTGTDSPQPAQEP